jgi:hypothetical protein
MSDIIKGIFIVVVITMVVVFGYVFGRNIYEAKNDAKEFEKIETEAFASCIEYEAITVREHSNVLTMRMFYETRYYDFQLWDFCSAISRGIAMKRLEIMEEQRDRAK